MLLIVGFNMPKKNKFLEKVDELKFNCLLKKYEEELESSGWRANDSVWGRIVKELGLQNTEKNRKLCYSEKKKELTPKKEKECLQDRSSINKKLEETSQTPHLPYKDYGDQTLPLQEKMTIDHHQKHDDQTVSRNVPLKNSIIKIARLT